MTLASRLNVLFLVTALFLGSLASIIAAHHDYQARLDSITRTSSARLAGHPKLQYLIYTRETEPLQSALDAFLSTDAASAALAYSGPGKLIARADRPGARALEPLPFNTVRGQLMS